MEPLRKRFFVNGKPTTGSTPHAEYLKPASVLLHAVKQRMQTANLQQLVQRYTTEDGATLTAISRFGQDEIRIDVPYAPQGKRVPLAPQEMIYTPRQRTIPGRGRVLIATGPEGGVYTVSADLTRIVPITDLVTPGPVTGIYGGPRSFSIAGSDRMQGLPEEHAAYPSLATFYNRSWVEQASVPFGFYATGMTFHLNRYVTVGWDTVYEFTEAGEETSRIDIGNPADAILRGVESHRGSLYGSIQSIGFEPNQNTTRIYRWPPLGSSTDLVAERAHTTLAGLAAHGGNLYSLRVTLFPASETCVTKISASTGEVLANSDPIVFSLNQFSSPVAVDDRFVYVIGFDWRETEYAYMVKVFTHDLVLRATLEVPRPGYAPSGFVEYTYAIGFDPYWMPEVTIDEGVIASPA